jgi:hypothetical protein
MPAFVLCMVLGRFLVWLGRRGDRERNSLLKQDLGCVFPAFASLFYIRMHSSSIHKVFSTQGVGMGCSFVALARDVEWRFCSYTPHYICGSCCVFHVFLGQNLMI